MDKDIRRHILQENIEELRKVFETNPEKLFQKIGDDEVNLLILAIIKNKPKVVDFFVEIGFDVNSTDRRKKNALYHACSERYDPQILESILKSKDIDVTFTDSKKRTILHRCVMKGYTRSLEILSKHGKLKDILNCQDCFGSTAIHLSIRFHKEESEIFLLSQEGIDINIVDNKGRNPLHFACFEGAYKSAERLIKANVDVNAADQSGNTPLHYACSKGGPDLVRLLASAGANLNAENKNGETPLHICINMRNEASAQALSNAGADISVRYDPKFLERRKEELKKRILNKSLASLEVSTLDADSSEEEELEIQVEDPTKYKLDSFGFIKDENEDSELRKEQSMKIKQIKEELKIRKWIKLIKKWDKIPKDVRLQKVHKLVYKGVPNAVRPQAWRLITNIDSIKNQHGISYQTYVEKKADPKIINQIDLDINRSSRNHIMFKERYGQGQVSLFNILKSYSSYNPTLGYCQSMSDLVAFMLKYIEEEETFWLLIKITKDKAFQFEGRYIEGFPLLKRCFYVHNRLLEKTSPKLYKHLQKNGLDPELYALKFYMKPFIDVFPFDMVLRAWDIFLFEGSDVLYSLVISLLLLFEKEILAQDEENLTMYITTINKLPEGVTIDKWISDAKELKFKSKLIRQLELEYDQQRR